MKKVNLIPLIVVMLLYSCKKSGMDDFSRSASPNLVRYNNKVIIDTTLVYIGDSLYMNLLKEYNSKTKIKTRSLSPEDDAFFNRKFIVKSTEATVLYGRNYIYPGSILEGNTISKQNYKPVFVGDRNPITVSMTLTHTTPKTTSRIIYNPSYSKLEDYVKEMVQDGSFEQSEKFMFQQKRFTFYDEIKTAFGTNIDTRKLFSSRKEYSTEKRDKIVKLSGMYIKFFQSSFTVNMDIAPLSSQPIKGSSNFEPVYVSSVTYGRLGVIVFETNQTYEFAEECIKKEFDRIFYHKKINLTEQERAFFENTDFKVLIIGGDSDYTVQTIKGYSQFLNLIYNSKFTATSYGVPITCSFTYANSHQMVETEFESTLYIEPLFVKTTHEDGYYNQKTKRGDYEMSDRVYINFYKDRECKVAAIPNTDILFNIYISERHCHYEPDYNHWPMIKMTCDDEKDEVITLRNIEFKSKIYIGSDLSYYRSSGPMPGMGNHAEPMYHWEADEYHKSHYLQDSPFFRKM